MRGSGTSRLAVIAVFVLIAGGVLGGMAWATVNSFRLATKTIDDERAQNIRAAVWEVDNYMQGILNAETARDINDYLAYHQADPVAVVSDDGVDLDAKSVILRSPLMFGPPHDWIDVYFHVAQDEVVSSPQVFDEARLALWDHSRAYVPSQRARETLQWLRRVLPGVDLHEQLAMVCRSERAPSETTGVDEPALPAAGGPPDAALNRPSRRDASRKSEQRRETLQRSQESYLPREACIDADVAEWNLRNLAGTAQTGPVEEAVEAAGQVGIFRDPIKAFWLGVGPDGGPKLAFVSECHADAAVFYQGFVGDWGRLKPRLIALIADLFPEADLEPVLDHFEPEHDTGARLLNLPVRVSVPAIPGGASAAAWSDIRGTVIPSWAAALAVLVVAGWGLRNLVALTERRMQFAYAVTHELRTPLTTFRLYADMLSAGLVPQPAQQEYLDTLNTESQRLSSLVEDVLEYARLQNHRVRLNSADMDATSLLTVISETLENRCEANGLRAETQNTIPNGQRIHTDVDLVHRVASVLVNNACRHARGSTDAVVAVRLGGHDGKIQLDVVDSGPGIDRRDARTIFRPFHRGHGADAAAHGGIGLGLALARSWAELLGGRLELTARHDPQFGGAHFRLTIPARTQT